MLKVFPNKNNNREHIPIFLCMCFDICFIYSRFNSFLKHYGKRCKAVITENGTSLFHRYTPNEYIYEFMIGDKTYTGNSLIEVGNKERVGDSIEVLYFKHAPFFNRPIYFYEDE